MAKVFADLIRYGKINSTTGVAWTINDVPERYREEVERLLNPNE